MTRKLRENKGVALILVLILIFGIAATAGLLVTRFLSDKSSTDQSVFRSRAIAAADAGIELAVRKLWYDYLAEQPEGETGNLLDFQGYLGSLGHIEGEPFQLLSEPRLLPNNAAINSITAETQSDELGMIISVQSTGSFHGVQLNALQTFRLQGEIFKGFGFALLANNINCIMCHADFDNVYRVNNDDASLHGTFDRIRIASLESLMIRTGSADSNIAGSYYTRGVIKNKSGALLSTLAGTSLTTAEFPKTGDHPGKLVETAGGDLVEANFELAGKDADGKYLPFASLYTNYPTSPELMTDGELPTSFPPVIPDPNGNKIVDDAEFSAVLDTFSQGSISGGTAFGVPTGGTYSSQTLPAASNDAISTLSSDGSYSGNLILVGTPQAPIEISGKIAVDGDLIIKGPIKGKGQIFARRNIYFVGDTTYDDAPGEFGRAADDTENLVAYAAGGNILIGDYLTPKNISDVNSSISLSAAGIDPGGAPNSGLSASFTMSEVTLFNRMEYQKKTADPSYTPRYYRLRDSAPVYRFNGTSEHGDKYNENFLAFTPPAGAAIVGLNPLANWIPELTLKKLWSQDELSRPTTGAPFRIDGLVYTNNAIFALARSSSHKSRTLGKIWVRGGMVAADVGILSPGDGGRGFTMHYDDRVRDFLGIATSDTIAFARLYRVIQ